MAEKAAGGMIGFAMGLGTNPLALAGTDFLTCLLEWRSQHGTQMVDETCAGEPAVNERTLRHNPSATARFRFYYTGTPLTTTDVKDALVGYKIAVALWHSPSDPAPTIRGVYRFSELEITGAHDGMIDGNATFGPAGVVPTYGYQIVST